MNILFRMLPKFYFAEEGAPGGGAPPAAPPAAPPVESWTKDIPDDMTVTVREGDADKQIKLKDHPSLTKFKSIPDVAKSYVESERYKSQLENQMTKAIVPPGKDAKPEEIEAYYNKLGRPAKPEEYKIGDLPKDIHPAIKPSPEAVKGFTGAMHKLGLTQNQLEGVNGFMLQAIHQSLSAQDKATQETMEKSDNEMRQEYGKDYEQNITLAKRFAERVWGKEGISALDGSNPVFLKGLVKLAKQTSEDQISNNGFSSLTVTPGGAKQKIDEIKNDPKSAYNDEANPKHSDAVKEMRELYKLAY